LGILGESGSGKSTLANAILQILPRNAKFDSGEIIFGDSDLLRLTESQLQRIRGRQISIVSQDPALALNPVLTIGTQITEVLRAHLPLTPQQRRQKALELLHEVDFDQPAAIYGAYPHQLSGGQRQRVVIAQAVACRPALLLADEPTSKLDASLQADMISLLARIRERHGTTILFISHDPALFTGFADRVAVMYAGRIVEAGQCSQIFRQPMHPYSQALLRIARASTDLRFPIKTRFPKIEGEPPDLRHGHGGCHFEPRCTERMDVCANRIPRAISCEPERLVTCLKYGE
jgi:oligopeptide/dipeptide ABC transporter ATP-binding protein